MIRLEHVTKSYKGSTVALRDVSVDIAKGEFVFLVGPSGSGKSTFLRLMTKEEEPDSGKIWVAGKEIGTLSHWKVPYLRRNIGSIFQNFNLLPNKTVYENVAFALEVIGRFFEKVVASDNSEKEFERIRDESSRFDEDFAINGLTLFQAIALSKELHGKFRYTYAGRESIGGKNVYVMMFEQIRPDPSVTVNKPGGSNNYDIEVDGDKSVELDARIRGKLWIDTDTFNIRRELRERTIQPVGVAKPIVVAENLLEYTDSTFGILTPKTLSHLQYRVRLKDGVATKDTRIVFEYGKFTQPDVEVKGEVKDKTQ